GVAARRRGVRFGEESSDLCGNRVDALRADHVEHAVALHRFAHKDCTTGLIGIRNLLPRGRVVYGDQLAVGVFVLAEIAAQERFGGDAAPGLVGVWLAIAFVVKEEERTIAPVVPEFAEDFLGKPKGAVNLPAVLIEQVFGGDELASN